MESVKSHAILVIKLAVVPKTLISSTRQSKRRASDSNQLTLQREEKIKAGRNMKIQIVKGSLNFNDSFLQLSDNAISSSLIKLGINANSDSNFDFDNAIKDIRKLKNLG